MIPEGSLPRSQEPTTSPYPEPDQSSPGPRSLENSFEQILPSTPRPFPQISPLNPQTCHMPPSPCSSRYYHLNYILSGVPTMKLFIMPSPPVPCYLVPPRPKYLPQHPTSNTLSPCFSPNMRPIFTTISNNGQNYISVYLHFWIGNKNINIMNRVVAGNPWIQSPLNLWMQFWFVTVLPKHVEACSILSMDLLPIFTLWFCPALYSQNLNMCLFATAFNFFWERDTTFTVGRFADRTRQVLVAETPKLT